jgi:hypothetical protein
MRYAVVELFRILLRLSCREWSSYRVVLPLILVRKLPNAFCSGAFPTMLTASANA